MTSIYADAITIATVFDNLIGGSVQCECETLTLCVYVVVNIAIMLGCFKSSLVPLCAINIKRRCSYLDGTRNCVGIVVMVIVYQR